MNKKGFLILEDGTVFQGTGFGAEKDVFCEFVFNTGMTGHSGILSDPVNTGLGIVASFPVVGAWGAEFTGKEKFVGGASALVCREASFCPPNNVNAQNVSDFMLSKGITGLQGVDTRELARKLRDAGGMKGAITFDENPGKADILAQIKEYRNGGLVEKVTAKNIEVKSRKAKNIAVLDLGGAKRLSEALRAVDFGVAVYPAGTAAADILKDKPDGIIITEGPCDPADCAAYIPAVKGLTESGLPVFGIGLGHQLMAAAHGFKTVKLAHGHRGANYPVKETATGKMYITGQNHGYIVDKGSVDKAVADIFYINLHDGSVEGLEYKDGLCASLQFFPDFGEYVLRPNALFAGFMERISLKDLRKGGQEKK